MVKTMTLIKTFSCIFILALVSTVSLAQTANVNWVPVASEEGKITYINVTGLASFRGEDIYVWSLQEYNPPVIMDEEVGEVYKTKTYYLFNKEQKRYSIMQIILYSDNDNVLKSFNYDRNMNLPDFKYSQPIMRNSDAEKIFMKCMEIIRATNQ
jgi:hypothetical protein